MILHPPKKTMRNWWLLQRIIYEFVKLILPRFMRFFFRFEVNGIHLANKFPEGTPVIFCSNHRSHLDALIFASAVVHPYGKRTTCGFMASGKAMQNNFLFGLVKYLGAFPVYPDNPEPALDHSFKLLQENYAVFLAPQGKRIPSTPLYDYHNLIREGKTGVGRLVLRFNGKIPVIPMYIHGSREALRRGKIIPKFRSFISVTFCKPLLFPQFTREEGWDTSTPEFYSTARKVVDAIMTSIREQMLKQEEAFIKILEMKFRTPVEQIQISPKSKPKVDRILFKLLEFHHEDLKRYLERNPQN
ncbi:MAG: lysophospholipid acyltransferase family protein [Candidatus Hodarchaeota archaeon]